MVWRMQLDTPFALSVAGIVGVLVVIGAVAQIAVAYRAFRRSPSIDRELGLYITRSDHAEEIGHLAQAVASERAERREEVDKIWQVVNGHKAGTERMFQDIMRALGKIEGKLEN